MPAQPPPVPTVHLVDDDDAFREALAGLLRASEVAVQTYASAEAYLAEATAGPGCLLLDVHLPGLTGLALQARLQSQLQTQLQSQWRTQLRLPDDATARPIVFLTGAGDIPMTVQALKAGAEDFLTKPVDRRVLLEAVRRAFDRDALQRGQAQARDAVRARLARLTPRESEVSRHLATGQLNKQIAHALGTTERTVKAHRAQVMDKLGIRSVAELVQLLAAAGG